MSTKITNLIQGVQLEIKEDREEHVVDNYQNYQNGDSVGQVLWAKHVDLSGHSQESYSW